MLLNTGPGKNERPMDFDMREGDIMGMSYSKMGQTVFNFRNVSY